MPGEQAAAQIVFALTGSLQTSSLTSFQQDLALGRHDSIKQVECGLFIGLRLGVGGNASHIVSVVGLHIPIKTNDRLSVC